MNKYSRLGKNTLLVFAGNTGSKIINFVMLPLYTRWLTVEDYGITDIISVYVSLCTSVVSCCISESIFIFPKDKNKKVQSEYFTTAFIFLLKMILLFGILSFAVHYFFGVFSISNSFTKNIAYIFFLLVSTLLQQFVQQFVRSIDRMKIYSTTGIVQTVSTAVFAILMIPYFGVLGYVLSLIIANFIATLYSLVFSRAYRYFHIKYNTCSRLLEMLRYSIPLIPNTIMWWIVNALNRPLMESYLGLHDIGIFAIANKFPGILTLLFSVFGTSWQISVIEEYGRKDYHKFYNNTFKVIFGFLIISLLGITFFSKLIVSIFTTDRFYDAWMYIPLLTFGVLFSNISGFVGCNFSAARKSKYYFYSSISGAVSSIVFNFTLIPLFGIWGVCLSIVLSFFVMCITRLFFSWRFATIDNISYYIFITLISLISILLYSLNYIIPACIASFSTLVGVFVLEREFIKTVLKYKL